MSPYISLELPLLEQMLALSHPYVDWVETEIA